MPTPGAALSVVFEPTARVGQPIPSRLHGLGSWQGFRKVGALIKRL